MTTCSAAVNGAFRCAGFGVVVDGRGRVTGLYVGRVRVVAVALLSNGVELASATFTPVYHFEARNGLGCEPLVCELARETLVVPPP